MLFVYAALIVSVFHGRRSGVEPVSQGRKSMKTSWTCGSMQECAHTGPFHRKVWLRYVIPYTNKFCYNGKCNRIKKYDFTLILIRITHRRYEFEETGLKFCCLMFFKFRFLMPFFSRFIWRDKVNLSADFYIHF